MYIPHSERETEDILKLLGLSKLEDLFSHIDASLLSPSRLPPPMSEEELRRYFKETSQQNKPLVCFAGYGVYDRIVPSVIWQILNRGEFLTAYTPYQPEASQGTLQAIFEYQTLVCQLTGMEVANASMYDGASALAEAVLMARAVRGKGRRVVISEGVHPLYRKVVETYLMGYRDEIVQVPVNEEGYTRLDLLEDALKDQEAHAVVLQYPNFLGFVEDLRKVGELTQRYRVPLVVVADPIALAILKPPGQMGADIVVGEAQPMGMFMNYGGPYAGFFATKQEYVRRMPGRLVGMGEDIEGKRAFLLVLQTREQHIRRERATSNICTNQNLMAMASLIYMVLLGKEGMRQVALQSLSKALYLKKRLLDLGFQEVYKGRHLWEFPLRHPQAMKLRNALLKEGFLLGVPLRDDTLLLAVTEKRTKEEMDKLCHLIEMHLDR
ncbi:Glycine dehydrogenase (decarboxylating) [Thermocrinis albus DSM 14484]|uniref:Probable glycine dehydrogenase (decarboxylating) subunit 1 n=1 Tax=Thermocrinis albus (strain DSM 14484 / JCM 11386 / HI 11/12) TaxID=638303 RepID=D3SLE3_THEAH|nr:aminomethyl-transferring glycine dehydrogenase subunit GcvPA [Thermocrinis albus]ADC89573.1 Glycine dehydrogenase (decarboxylating) [Thermocrinis albus DSM 14484]